jgi:hypothetical protein
MDAEGSRGWKGDEVFSYGNANGWNWEEGMA